MFNKNIIPTWQILSLLIKYPVFHISFSVMFIVPLLSRISAAVENNHHISSIINQFLDTDITFIPTNMLRLFYSATFLIIGELIYFIFRPIENEYKEWVEKDEEAILLKNNLMREHGTKNSEKAEQLLKKTYDSIRIKSIKSKPFIRLIISLCYIISAYLILRVLLDQIQIVFHFSNISRIFL